ncbi:MAG: ribosome biogenesis GTPase Der [Gammaproteobacteria bacterium]|nr:MAG: ribosome biogenesis GTPase Der [Gammaproteobacteria bacterium]
MYPVLALVGRPNVGKSTLFNKLTNRRDALVADVPGLTRDRRYGRATIEGQVCTLVDTGGLFGEAGDLSRVLEHQAELAIDEANVVLFLVDGRAGLTPIDQDIATLLRRRELAVMLVVNKMDGANRDEAMAEFATLGFAHVAYVSAVHGRGVSALSEGLQDLIPEQADETSELAEAAGAVRMAIIGRPNVGKSTLGNRLLGEERLVVYDQPGTTRDAIAIPFVRDKKSYVLIDTAGVRRKGRVEGVVEKFSVVKTLQAIDEAHVVILVMDAREGVVDQDLHILAYAVDAGAGVIVAMNKWDGLTNDKRDAVRRTLDRRLKFAPWITFMQISALHGTGVGHLMREVDRVFKAGELDVGTSVLTRLLNGLVEAHSPPSVRGRAIKLRYAHKIGAHPPRIAIYGNQTQSLPVSYRRYLQNGFREALDLVGNPVHLELKTGKNPYAGKRNELNKRQQAQRRRIIQHRKKKR